MYLIVGLGNPGIAYRKSRHNAGFMALDELASTLRASVTKRGHRSLSCECRYEGEKLILAKPQTYMNLSGEAVSALLKYYRLTPDKLIVMYDDIDIAVGTLRIRASGSAGTHNGMRSIIACLNGEEGFPRVRIGVGRQEGGADLAKHVLAKPSKEEQALLEKAYENAAQAAMLIVNGKLLEAQSRFN